MAQSTQADLFTHMFYLDTPFFAKPTDYIRVEHVNPNNDNNGIRHRNSWEIGPYEFGLD